MKNLRYEVNNPAKNKQYRKGLMSKILQNMHKLVDFCHVMDLCMKLFLKMENQQVLHLKIFSVGERKKWSLIEMVLRNSCVIKKDFAIMLTFRIKKYSTSMDIIVYLWNLHELLNTILWTLFSRLMQFGCNTNQRGYVCLKFILITISFIQTIKHWNKHYN